MTVFNLLRKEIRRCLEKVGIRSPTEIQKIAIPEILKGKNVIISSPVGSGKTEAALLPIFHMFLERRPKPISILYITPLRALNRDLLDRLKIYSEELGIDIQIRHGDTSENIRRKQSKKPMDMLITTPETLHAIIVGKRIREYLRNVRHVIIDEAHELINSKRGCLLISTLERLEEMARFQRICLSATVSDEELFKKFFKCDIVLKVNISKEFEITVERPRVYKKDKEISSRLSSNIDFATKLRRICEILDEKNSCLIFTNTRDSAEFLAHNLKIFRNDVELHHGSLSRDVREEAEKRLKKGDIKALVCTSSLELGIDIGRIDFVIQYNSPRQVIKLLQRVGRSCHKIGEKSRGIIISTDLNEIFESLSILDLMSKGYLEKPKIYEKPYDILALQIVGIVLDYNKVEVKKVLEILKRCYIFRNLTEKDVEHVASLLNDMKVIWFENGLIGKTRKSRKFYYENLSVIPEEKRFEAIDILTDKKIGTLDECFVIRLNKGDYIILNGRIWRVIDIHNDKIYLEQEFSQDAKIPRWIGEEIPVEYEVARNVLKIMNNIDCISFTDKYTRKFLKAILSKQRNLGYKIPSESELYIEVKGKEAILHTYLGTKMNNTLAFLYKYLLNADVDFDAYRLYICAKRNLCEEDIKRILKVDPERIIFEKIHFEDIFKWKFLQVARRLSIVPKDLSHRQISLDRIIEAYRDTFIFEEAVKETITDYFDINGLKNFLDKLKRGSIKIIIQKVDEFSPLAKLFINRKKDLHITSTTILDIVKRRLFERKLTLFCLYCKSWKVTLKVSTIFSLKDIRCENCKSRMLAIIKDESILDVINKKKLSKEDKRKLERIRDSAVLFMNYGINACLVLAGYGIGVETAKRILRNSWSEEDLIRNILEAEKEYIRTRKYWD